MKTLFVLLILSLAIALGGCTLNESTQQRHRRLLQITDLQMRMAVEDWDHVWMYDRSSNLTESHPRIGG